MKAHIKLNTRAADENTNFKKVGSSGQNVVMAFSPPEYCRSFSLKKNAGLQRRGGLRAPQDSPKFAKSYANCKSYLILQLVDPIMQVTIQRNITSVKNHDNKLLNYSAPLELNSGEF